MFRRIKHIRSEFPKAHSGDVAARLRREIADAESQADEPLVHPLPTPTRTLYVFIETTPHMVQLDLVHEYLVSELPAAMTTAGVERVSFVALGSDGSAADAAPSLASEPLDCSDPAMLEKADAWLRSISGPAATRETSSRGSSASYRLSKALRWATAADALGSGCSVVLLVACSRPSDLEVCIGLLRRSEVVLRVGGVFGAAPEDPEPALQRLADAAAPGSSLQLFFGPAYWTRFVAARSRQLERVEREAQESADKSGDGGEGEIVSAKVFEMRLIERIMRECYAEEQQCEEELVCASRVLERTLVDQEDILAVLHEKAPLALSPPAAQLTAR